MLAKVPRMEQQATAAQTLRPIMSLAAAAALNTPITAVRQTR